MAVIKNEGVSSEEFEKRIGNLNGIERNFNSRSILRLWLTTGEIRVAQLYKGNTGITNGPGIGTDMETALVNLDRICFDSKYIQPERSTGTNIASEGNNIEKWLKNKGNIWIRQEPSGQRFVVFEDNDILAYLVDNKFRSSSDLKMIAHMDHSKISYILASINSEIIPTLFEFIREKSRITSQKSRRGRREQFYRLQRP